MCPLQVVARIRPQNELEISKGGQVSVLMPNRETIELQVGEAIDNSGPRT
jgi:hypothetical protein